jgi:hypothetical protein
MGCEWILQIVLKIIYKDGETSFCDPSVSKGVYVAHDEIDVDKQMKQWEDLCPNTIIYENEKWNSYDDMPSDVVYVTREWCGVSLKCSRNNIDDIENMSDVLRIETVAYAERKY